MSAKIRRYLFGGKRIPTLPQRRWMDGRGGDVHVEQHRSTRRLLCHRPRCNRGGNCTAQGKCWYEQVCPTLKGAGVHAVFYDARGNGGDGVCPTITGDHQDRITDYTAIVLATPHPPTVDMPLDLERSEQAAGTWGGQRDACASKTIQQCDSAGHGHFTNHRSWGGEGGNNLPMIVADYISDDPTPKVGGGCCPHTQSRTEGMHNHLSDGRRNA